MENESLQKTREATSKEGKRRVGGQKKEERFSDKKRTEENKKGEENIFVKYREGGRVKMRQKGKSWDRSRKKKCRYSNIKNK